MRDEYEEKLRKIEEKNDLLKQQLEEEKCLNDKHEQTIATLEQHFKDFQLASSTSSFSKFTKEEFKQMAYKIHDDF